MGKFIYLDNAATTKVKEEALNDMLPFFREYYGNASANYSFADKARTAINKARSEIATVLSCNPREIYFTAGGSESDNWALKAVADSYKTKGNHIITSKIEHHAILNTCKYLERHGFEVTYLDVDKDGKIDLDKLESVIRDTTILISIMAANNEIGTLQPLSKIGQIARKHGVLFHTDAVQAFGHIPLDVNDLNIDLLSASGHKFGGPKGVGFLYVREGTKISSFIHGGAQERSRRAGTYNTAGIVGMGTAARISLENLEEKRQKISDLRDYFISRIKEEITFTKLNGHRTDRLPGNVNFTFRFIEGDSVLILLDKVGICASSGSACTSGSNSPSHVLLAINLTDESARSSLRFSLSEETTIDDIDYTIDEFINPKAIIIIGRSNNFTKQEIKDFEIIRRKYKNIIDIITYDDLINRFETAIKFYELNKLKEQPQ